jgi:hypothetical protein
MMGITIALHSTPGLRNVSVSNFSGRPRMSAVGSNKLHAS